MHASISRSCGAPASSRHVGRRAGVILAAGECVASSEQGGEPACYTAVLVGGPMGLLGGDVLAVWPCDIGMEVNLCWTVA